MLQATTEAPVTVLLVEDDAVTQRMLTLAVEEEPSLRLQAALDSVQSACDWLEAQAADILLVDLGLPDGSGIDVIRHCARRHPGTHVMVITTSSDEDSVVASIEAGASGYLLKDAGRMDIVRSIRELQDGGSPISPTIALTKRETSILELIARGDTYVEVARQLSLSVGTVQTHIKNIYDKLSVHSRGEAVYEANRRGLLQMDRLKSR